MIHKCAAISIKIEGSAPAKRKSRIGARKAVQDRTKMRCPTNKTAGVPPASNVIFCTLYTTGGPTKSCVMDMNKTSY